MAVGLYLSPEDDAPARVLISGTPVEILDRSGALCRVSLSDGDAGWLECRYLTDEKPARAMLVEAQARIGSLWEEIDGMKRRLATKDREIEELERRLKAAEGRFPGPSHGPAGTTRAEPLDAGPVVRGRGGGEGGDLPAALLGAIGGASIAAAAFLWRSRRRYNGLGI
jgi:hypothetical protein